MIERRLGRIVFISSESGVQIPEEMIHYGTTKAAQLALVNGIAQLTRGTGVTVNAILPGPTDSEGVTELVGQLASNAQQSPEQFEKEFFRACAQLHYCNDLRQWMKLHMPWFLYPATCQRHQ
jgi:NAD(P)-dependent dehydrogenase (short-subunit alcohol dehydrogenase family)